MPPPESKSSETFFKLDPGRGQEESSQMESLIKKPGKGSESDIRHVGVKGILLGPPGAGKGTQVCVVFCQKFVPDAVQHL